MDVLFHFFTALAKVADQDQYQQVTGTGGGGYDWDIANGFTPIKHNGSTIKNWDI